MTHNATLNITDADTAELRSPSVGRFRAAIKPGAFVSGGDTLGHLEILGRAEPVQVPRTSNAFQVRVITGERGPEAIGYGDLLASLVPAAAGGEGFSLPRPASAEGLPDNAIAIEAPTDGLFYSAPSPETPPFVALGDTIEPGQVVGLVEVMKFFYEIRFESDGPAKVVRLIATDADPIETGTPVLYAVPA